ncbi:molybdenum cofactor sulfurase [Stylonychia lemnae]|uniref:Molybdenum cofactor sulfurase n=1 Tax=Stylonychia lemnae TaxID=5949 RepID=A0A078AYZ9_STYLE|nr:molybdenum cofactor sulfurase [Stylonychia lemnae]|eukprot:CDW86028.1 molybdenum cofactor sulfurase [Stylonychia lemnae]
MCAITHGQEQKLSLLEQKIEKDIKTKLRYLVITCIDPIEAARLPSKDLRIQITKIKGPVFTAAKGQKGISEGPFADEWLSKLMGKNVFLLRSATDYVKNVPDCKIIPKKIQGGQAKGFISKAAIKIMNEASVRDLKQRVIQKLKLEENDKIKIDTIAFRPNIVIDSFEPYSEDAIQEARIGSVMMRLVGYCNRSNLRPDQIDTFDDFSCKKSKETLAQYRKNEYGTLFGTYYQAEIIESQSLFNKLFTGYHQPNFRKNLQQYGIIKTYDEFKVRVKGKKLF